MAVILEFGFNATDYGKTVLAARPPCWRWASSLCAIHFHARLLCGLRDRGNLAALAQSEVFQALRRAAFGAGGLAEASLAKRVIDHAHCCVPVAG
ncbi:hypothetical protein WKW80_17210 [Variovorax humicola]|uniref:Uncharacterized protein n=1 Tax=Variovorax humicola TaxID=1769758 RepID=A0ABU8W116_9BURK